MLVDNEPDLQDPSLAATDIEVSNGVIHVIDRVLIPLDIPGNDFETITIEAEDFDLDGFRVRGNSSASENQVIQVGFGDDEASASTEFVGPGGEYDLEVFYYDEIDGESTIEVLVNGDSVATIDLDQELGGRFATSQNATSMVIEDLQLDAGDTIELVGMRDDREYVRIDKITISASDSGPVLAMAPEIDEMMI